MSLRQFARRALERLADQPEDKQTLGSATRRLDVNGRERSYDLFLSPDLDTTKKSPIIFGFHGRNSAPAQFAYVSQLSRRGGGQGYVIAYPAAQEGVWDAAPTESNYSNNDVAFAQAMLEDISTVVAIDPFRIFATGMSNGGQMAYRLACELSDRIAAIAVCACGLKRGECRPRNAVSVLHFHGTQDPLVPFAWGRDAVDQWIEFDDCEGVPIETYRNGAAICLTYSNPLTHASVALCTIDGMGHQWPGLAIRLSEGETRLLGLPAILSRLGPGTDDVDATGMLLSFFSNHPMRQLGEFASEG
jgi:polyhydroxybutyrate depolymerase